MSEISDWKPFTQQPDNCSFYLTDRDRTWGYIRDVGETMMLPFTGCFTDGKKKLLPTQEVFLIQQYGSKCDKSVDLKIEDKVRYEVLLKELYSKYPNDYFLIGNNLVIRYKTMDELVSQLFQRFESSIKEGDSYQLYQFEGSNFYPLIVKMYRKIAYKNGCPCCYPRGFCGPRGPRGACGPDRECTYTLWHPTEFLNVLTLNA